MYAIRLQPFTCKHTRTQTNTESAQGYHTGVCLYNKTSSIRTYIPTRIPKQNRERAGVSNRGVPMQQDLLDGLGVEGAFSDTFEDQVGTYT
jgi:hypothetical protein